MVGPGNHEIEYGSDGSTFLAFEHRYKMPSIKPAEIGAITIPPSVDWNTGRPWCASSVFQQEYNYGNSFFSFEAGSAHVIYVNPYSTTDANSVQYKWLAQDLSAVDRSITPWVIVFMHCPWYNSNRAHHAEKQAEIMRDSMEELFYKSHVNVVFAGHVHAYERTYPIFRNETRTDGVVYITIGDAGNREGHANTYYDQPSWSAYRNGTQYGHGQLSLWSKDKLTWRWFRNVDGQVISKDEMTLCNSAFGSVQCA
jgi:acid phosphatase type 7